MRGLEASPPPQPSAATVGKETSSTCPEGEEARCNRTPHTLQEDGQPGRSRVFQPGLDGDRVRRNSGRPAPGHRSASCLAATASIVLRHAQASARRRADPYAQRQQRKAVRRNELTELLHGAIAGWEVRNEIIWGYTC